MATKEQQIQALLEPTVEALGFELWGLEYLSQGRHSTLRLYIESEQGISVDDCAAVSEQVSSVLDVEDPISGHYNLEVSSPGLDRPLFTADHYRQFVGEEARVTMYAPVDGRRKFRGEILGCDDESVRLRQDGEEVVLDISNIAKARLVPDYDAILAASKN